MKVIGITGPTGAGKTTALKALEELGGVVIDCDQVYHELLAGSAPMNAELRREFGDGMFAPDGTLERKALGAIVFQNRAALEKLNTITHAFVGEAVDKRLARARASGAPCAGIDAIALIESGLGETCDCTVAVTAPDEVRVRRIMAREGISEEYARTRAAAQKEEAWFRANCTYVLVNNCASAEEFHAKAKAFWQKILSV